MKTHIKNLFRLTVLIAGLGLMLAGAANAQTFTTLHNFSSSSINSSGYLTNSEGANPYAGLVLSGETLYGTAFSGGSSGYGTVFKVNTNGTGFMNLHSFAGGWTADDGYGPQAGLILSGNNLYGTTIGGSASFNGTVFKLDTVSMEFTNLYSFTSGLTNTDGAYPIAPLISSGKTLYGAAYNGGSSDRGTVFRLNTDGSGFTNLHSFTTTSNSYPHGNSEGASPAGLVLSDNTLYGTSTYGGTSGIGTVFKLNTDGTGFTTLHSFTAPIPHRTNFLGGLINDEGGYPQAGLTLSGDTLYGTAPYGGSGGLGTVFAVNTDGTGFRTLHSFADAGNGAVPEAGLILSGNTLYGTTGGTVFAVNTDGTGFTILYRFMPTSSTPPYTNHDGANPLAGLVLSGNTLYGTASRGGDFDRGTVFSIFIQPQLTIVPSGQYVILTWPTNYDGFTLQSTTNLISPVWVTNLPAPVVVNGQNTVTNPISGRQQFFRLSQ